MAKSQSEEQFWLAANGMDLEGENVTTFQTGQLTREAARSGLGVTVMTAPIAAPQIASGLLVALCEEENSVAAYHVLTRPEVISHQRNTFVKWLKAEALT